MDLAPHVIIDRTEISNPKLVVIVGSFGLASNIVGLFLFHGMAGLIIKTNLHPPRLQNRSLRAVLLRPLRRVHSRAAVHALFLSRNSRHYMATLPPPVHLWFKQRMK